MDCECYSGALHPVREKQNEIWINIGSEFGEDVQLTMGVGEMDDDGLYDDYVAFGMDSVEEIDAVISMLNEAKRLLIAYRVEFELDVYGPTPADGDESA